MIAKKSRWGDCSSSLRLARPAVEVSRHRCRTAIRYWLSKNIFCRFASQRSNREYYLTSEALPLNRVTKRKSRSSPPAALPLCRSARTSGGTANYRSVVPQKVFVCSLRHNGKNFHSFFWRNPDPAPDLVSSPTVVLCVFSGVEREGAAQAGCEPRRADFILEPGTDTGSTS